jgi:hypothetical protein
MGWKRAAAAVLFIGIAEVAGAQPAPREVLSAREAAWRAWFAGDEATLRGLLPADFVGIGWSDAPFASLDTTLAQSKAFREGGGRLLELEFPETRAQALGADVVVLYGRFRVVIESGGARQAVAGRLTELFVRRDGRWLHPGWHLDEVKPAP